MSDQDFFFDEDEPKADAPKADAAPKKSTASSKPAAKAAVAAAPAEQSVTMTVTILVGVVTALLGVIIGIFIGRGIATPAVPASTGTVTAPAGQTNAPQLTPEQLQGGELPPGHPAVGGAAPETGTPSAETTKN